MTPSTINTAIPREHHADAGAPLLARTFVVLSAVSILAVCLYAFLWLSGESDAMRRESGQMGFGLLTVLTAVALLMALLGSGRRATWWATSVLAVASLMCLGPMAAWISEIAGNVRDLDLLSRPLVVPGLVGLVLGVIGVIGAVTCLVRTASTQRR